MTTSTTATNISAMLIVIVTVGAGAGAGVGVIDHIMKRRLCIIESEEENKKKSLFR